MSEGGKNLREFIKQQQWFKDAVDELAEEKAMVMLDDLIGLGVADSVANGTVDPLVALADQDELDEQEDNITPIRRAGGYRLKWHTMSGDRHDRGHMVATGPNGERCEAKHGPVRARRASNQQHHSYWWHAIVDGVRIPGECYSLRDAKLTCEHKVFDNA